MVDVKHPAALGWKHNHAPGIETVDGVLTAWPGSLGPFPTQAQINQWEAEWLAHVNDPANSDTRIDDIVRALMTPGVSLPLSAADIAGAKRNRPGN